MTIHNIWCTLCTARKFNHPKSDWSGIKSN